MLKLDPVAWAQTMQTLIDNPALLESAISAGDVEQITATPAPDTGKRETPALLVDLTDDGELEQFALDIESAYSVIDSSYDADPSAFVSFAQHWENA